VTSLVALERANAETRFPPHQRCLDWEERWVNYASVLGETRPVMAYVRDEQTQRISPICKNLARSSAN
jgi:hypothetical protein